MFGIVACLRRSATSARFYFVTWLGERVAADLRRDLFERILGLSQDYFEQARTGDILSRLTADIAVLQALIGSADFPGARNALTVLGASAMLVVDQPEPRRDHCHRGAAGGRTIGCVRPEGEASVSGFRRIAWPTRCLCRGGDQWGSGRAGIHL